MIRVSTPTPATQNPGQTTGSVTVEHQGQAQSVALARQRRSARTINEHHGWPALAAAQPAPKIALACASPPLTGLQCLRAVAHIETFLRN
jgi:hypothetical protein